jgi:hypothetical protein
MTQLVLCVLAAVTLTKLSPERLKALGEVKHFHSVYTKTNLPPAIVVLCADQKGRLAEPQQKWQVTDVILDDTLPFNRLIWAATDGEKYVVHYECGGIGHSFRILVAILKRGDSKPTVLWCGVGSGRLNSFQSFVSALEGDKLDGWFENPH